MQNGHRWVVREKTTGKWVKSVDGSPFRIELVEDLAEALRYGTRFRAEDDASYLTNLGKDKRISIHGQSFEVWEFEDSDRARQVDPHLVFTPKAKKQEAEQCS